MMGKLSIPLRVRLMVGHCPLEASIGVRVPDPQQSRIGSDDRVSSELEIQRFTPLHHDIPAESRIQKLKDRHSAVFEFARIKVIMSLTLAHTRGMVVNFTDTPLL